MNEYIDFEALISEYRDAAITLSCVAKDYREKIKGAKTADQKDEYRSKAQFYERLAHEKRLDIKKMKEYIRKYQ